MARLARALDVSLGVEASARAVDKIRIVLEWERRR